MKVCRNCGRLFPEDAKFCASDGGELYWASREPTPEDAADPLVGDVVFGRYQVRRVVADGAMGRVYEALDMHERRHVALKVLHDSVAADPVSVARFQREFDVSKQLAHQHVIEVLDFLEMPNGGYCLVMEFLDGQELIRFLDGGRVIHPWRMIRLISQAAQALAPAHAAHVIHRDLKPENLFVCENVDGFYLKILDFGSVKAKGEGIQKLTILGTTIGSPSYMPPEQAQGKESIDGRADVWALATIVYETLSGVKAFDGRNTSEILLAIMTKEPKKLSELTASESYRLPPTLDLVIASALKKNPSERTASVEIFAQRLGEAFGLSGTYLEWAERSEDSLREGMKSFDELVQQFEQSRLLADQAAEDFFGELGALTEEEQPQGLMKSSGRTSSFDKGPPSSSSTSGASKEDSLPALPLAGIPKSGGMSWVWFLLGLLLVAVVYFIIRSL